MIVDSMYVIAEIDVVGSSVVEAEVLSCVVISVVSGCLVEFGVLGPLVTTKVLGFIAEIDVDGFWVVVFFIVDVFVEIEVVSFLAVVVFIVDSGIGGKVVGFTLRLGALLFDLVVFLVGIVETFDAVIIVVKYVLAVDVELGMETVELKSGTVGVASFAVGCIGLTIGGWNLIAFLASVSVLHIIIKKKYRIKIWYMSL